MFPSDLFPQLVNFAEQLFLVPGQGFGYVYFAFGSDTKIGEVTSFLVNKLPSVRIELFLISLPVNLTIIFGGASSLKVGNGCEVDISPSFTCTPGLRSRPHTLNS